MFLQFLEIGIRIFCGVSNEIIVLLDCMLIV